MADTPIPAPPEPAVTRLSLYLRHLEELRADGVVTISSTRIGSAVGCSAAQVRKDLGYFGQFGRRGVGYPVEDLAASLRHILGTHRLWPTALVGVGNLGSALLAYEGFKRRGFMISCAFDNDPQKIGRVINSVLIRDVAEFSSAVCERGIRLGIIAVGARTAQTVVDMMIRAGIEGILNFAPTQVRVPDTVVLYAEDLAIRLEQITYHLMRRGAAETSSSP